MNNIYDAILLGGSLFSLGYASTHANTLILEESETIGAEFIATFRPASVSPDSGSLSSYLTEFGLVCGEGERVNTPAMQPVLSKLAVDLGLDVRLLAKTLEVILRDGFYEVWYHTNSGLRRAVGRRVIDTTPRGLRERFEHQIKSSIFRLLCISSVEDFPKRLAMIFGARTTVEKGFAEGETIVSVPFPAGTDFHSARAAVTEDWRAAFAAEPAAISIMCFAYDYEYFVPGPEALQDILWIPPAGKDLSAAFRCGADYEIG